MLANWIILQPQGLESVLPLAPGPAPGIGFVILWSLFILVHVAFAIGVAVDARRRRTVLVPRMVWVLAVLMGGPLVALAYWVMHVSSFAEAVKARS